MSDLQPDEKVCPYCAEVIKAAAVKCRYCQSELVDTTVPASIPINLDKDVEPTPEPTPDPVRDPVPVPVSTDDREDHPDGDRLDPATRSAWAPDLEPQPQSFLAGARLLAALVVLCLVLAAVTGYAWYRSENPEQGAAPSGAITSSQARDAGMAAAARLTQQVLSYNWQTLDADTQAAAALLAPSFREEYTKTMAEVKDQTIKNQVKLTASAAATSIVSATEKKVVALVFINQVTTAKGTSNQRVDGSRVLVTLTRGAGEWRISKLKAF